MLRNRYLLIGLLAVVLFVLYYSFSGSDTSSSIATVAPAEYTSQLQAERQKKDDFFRTDASSPITDKTLFNGLLYYAPDLSYRVAARLEPFTDNANQKLVVHLTDGTEEVYDRVGYVNFQLNNTPCRLLVLKHDDTYSILFRDKTAGIDTYGGGRYIDLDAKAMQSNEVVVDFNAAYNPYCAYNHTYACPLPPAENKLPVAVQAGEKLKQESE